jgi:hypothetical protein
MGGSKGQRGRGGRARSSIHPSIHQGRKLNRVKRANRTGRATTRQSLYLTAQESSLKTVQYSTVQYVCYRPCVIGLALEHSFVLHTVPALPPLSQGSTNTNIPQNLQKKNSPLLHSSYSPWAAAPGTSTVLYVKYTPKCAGGYRPTATSKAALPKDTISTKCPASKGESQEKNEIQRKKPPMFQVRKATPLLPHLSADSDTVQTIHYTILHISDFFLFFFLCAIYAQPMNWGKTGDLTLYGVVVYKDSSA